MSWLKPCDRDFWLIKLGTIVEEFGENEPLSAIKTFSKKVKQESNEENSAVQYEDEIETSHKNLEVELMLQRFFDSQRETRPFNKEKRFIVSIL